MFQVEKALHFEPFTGLAIIDQAIAKHHSKLEKITLKLSDYLQNMKNGVFSSESQNDAFIKSINIEINKLKHESEKMADNMQKVKLVYQNQYNYIYI